MAPTASRFVENEHGRPAEEPFGEHDFLLIASAQDFYGLVVARPGRKANGFADAGNGFAPSTAIEQPKRGACVLAQ
jgi:hypothetical protein